MLTSLFSYPVTTENMGHDFLRHNQRCSVLVYVIDMSDEAPWDQLEMYQEGLSSRSAAVVLANKIDTEDSEDKL